MGTTPSDALGAAVGSPVASVPLGSGSGSGSGSEGPYDGDGDEEPDGESDSDGGVCGRLNVVTDPSAGLPTNTDSPPGVTTTEELPNCPVTPGSSTPPPTPFRAAVW
ncbi:hypothetical protein [Streptomyces sp. NBC_00286]|uniref:hypothetical protein n=1 Tax=Streptomyces sp. NBC_00286 TaxID=2975701 RepID=UPI002E286260|nr:hypothetical protein [Streptomyces sp. NBC_00286]